MSPSFVVWVLIGLSLLTANLPFIAERPFLMLPWTQAARIGRPAWLKWLASLLFLGLLCAASYFGFVLIGQALFVASDPASLIWFMGKLALATIIVVVLLAAPGRLNRGHPIQKSFLTRLLETLAFYGLVGALGFAFEANMGNRFPQTWEFYAVTLSLFLVLAYPGFVYRYLLRQRKRRVAPPAD